MGNMLSSIDIFSLLEKLVVSNETAYNYFIKYGDNILNNTEEQLLESAPIACNQIHFTLTALESMLQTQLQITNDSNSREIDYIAEFLKEKRSVISEASIASLIYIFIKYEYLLFDAFSSIISDENGNVAQSKYVEDVINEYHNFINKDNMVSSGYIENMDSYSQNVINNVISAGYIENMNSYLPNFINNNDMNSYLPNFML